MKRVYPLSVAVCILLTVIPRQTILGQCTCWTGLPATPVTQTFTLAPTNLSSASLIFPQFDPSIGDLSCMSLNYSLSAQSITGVRNLAPSTALLPTSNPDYSPTGRLSYMFSLLVSANVTGPGVSIIKPTNTVYGPDSLGASGQPDDTITYGPTNVLSNVGGSISVTPSGAYLGSGNAFLSYSISGGLSTILGGVNFLQKIQTTYWGNFTLTYYWCPAQPLATSLQNFTGVQNGNSILLKWQTTNEQNNIQYEIQASTDGQTFTTIGETTSNTASAGSTAKYQYQYDLNQIAVGKLYFRIKQTDASGKVTYSVIISVNPGGSADAGPVSYQTYPNPATNNITLQFNGNLTGRYLLELINTAGQSVLQRSVTMSGTSQISLDLNPQPAKGLYFLRTTDQTHGKSYVSKVFVQ